MAMGNYHISFTFILLLIRMINNLIVKKNPKKLENLCPFWNPLSHERLLQRRDGKSGGVSCRSVDGLAGKAGAIALLDPRVKMWFANGIIVLPVILICL